MTGVIQKTLPLLLPLQRRSIRTFSGGITVGLYYSPDLDKYFAISTGGQPMNVSEDIDDESD